MENLETAPEEAAGHRERYERLRVIKRALRDAGFPVNGDRFPYAMHHNFYRIKIRIVGRKCRHKDLGRLLDMWMSTRDNEDDLLWQVVSGAVRDMISREAGLVGRLPQEIRKGMASVDDGYQFLKFAKSLDFSILPCTETQAQS